MMNIISILKFNYCIICELSKLNLKNTFLIIIFLFKRYKTELENRKYMTRYITLSVELIQLWPWLEQRYFCRYIRCHEIRKKCYCK